MNNVSQPNSLFMFRPSQQGEAFLGPPTTPSRQSAARTRGVAVRPAAPLVSTNISLLNASTALGSPFLTFSPLDRRSLLESDLLPSSQPTTPGIPLLPPASVTRSILKKSTGHAPAAEHRVSFAESSRARTGALPQPDFDSVAMSPVLRRHGHAEVANEEVAVEPDAVDMEDEEVRMVSADGERSVLLRSGQKQPGTASVGRADQGAATAAVAAAQDAQVVEDDKDEDDDLEITINPASTSVLHVTEANATAASPAARTSQTAQQQSLSSAFPAPTSAAPAAKTANLLSAAMLKTPPRFQRRIIGEDEDEEEGAEEGEELHDISRDDTSSANEHLGRSPAQPGSGDSMAARDPAAWPPPSSTSLEIGSATSPRSGLGLTWSTLLGPRVAAPADTAPSTPPSAAKAAVSSPAATRRDESPLSSVSPAIQPASSAGAAPSAAAGSPSPAPASISKSLLSRPSPLSRSISAAAAAAAAATAAAASALGQRREAEVPRVQLDRTVASPLIVGRRNIHESLQESSGETSLPASPAAQTFLLASPQTSAPSASESFSKLNVAKPVAAVSPAVPAVTTSDSPRSGPSRPSLIDRVRTAASAASPLVSMISQRLSPSAGSPAPAPLPKDKSGASPEEQGRFYLVTEAGSASVLPPRRSRPQIQQLSLDAAGPASPLTPSAPSQLRVTLAPLPMTPMIDVEDDEDQNMGITSTPAAAATRTPQPPAPTSPPASRLRSHRKVCKRGFKGFGWALILHGGCVFSYPISLAAFLTCFRRR